ncbi:MAG: hypothetical protein LBR71_06720 [Synergistaceae bacterium]|jgi:hypothetical protein|nr:hypothetical protein [Synergistaceae bacterium]
MVLADLDDDELLSSDNPIDFVLYAGKQEGEVTGLVKGKIFVARSMLAESLPLEVIVKCSGLSVEEIASIR